MTDEEIIDKAVKEWNLYNLKQLKKNLKQQISELYDKQHAIIRDSFNVSWDPETHERGLGRISYQIKNIDIEIEENDSILSRVNFEIKKLAYKNKIKHVINEAIEYDKESSFVTKEEFANNLYNLIFRKDEDKDNEEQIKVS